MTGTPTMCPTYGRYLGDRTGVAEEAVTGPTPAPEVVRGFHRAMVITRAVDQEAIHLQRQGHLGVYAASRGQEAAQVGSASALRSSDWLFPSYRELGAAVVRGLPPEAILHAWRGTWFSAHDVLEHRFGLLTIPLATQTLHAVGLALASKQDGHDDVVLCYLGDGATSEGDAHEAFNFAAVLQVPVVFVVQNNQYAISVPFAGQTRAASLAHRAFGYGMPGYRCDGNDVLAVHAATDEAVRHARAGGGPSIVEAVTYRMEAHTTADDATRYRSAEELERWRQRDPIERVVAHLRGLDALDPADEVAVDHDARAEASRVRARIEASAEPEPAELFEHVLAARSPQLERQREEVLRGFAG